ncbi:MAG: thioredoxin family protein [Rikenellaceae bacterium]|nr:thioredoxin family protein [Rikenellaceae bacterium]MCL2693101.1 thioredoxin family protein [Rikenellaceae bacterium]
MKRIIFSTLLLLCATAASGQVNFRDITLAEALEQAAAENKLVFLDAYTVWCGPCRFMNAEILPQEAVSALLNERFVSVKFDMERGEGFDIARRYEVDVFPTYLLLRPDGTELHRLIGGSQTGEAFVERLLAGIEHGAVLSAFERQYAAGDRDAGMLLDFVEALVAAGQERRAAEISDNLFYSLTEDEKSLPQLWFIYENDALSSFGSENFDRILMHRAAFEASVGADVVGERIFTVLDRKVSDIIVGRDREATIGMAEAISDYIFENDIPNRQRLERHSSLALARLSANYPMMLELLELLAPQWNDEEVSAMYFSAAHAIRRNNDDAQRRRLVALSNSLLQRDDLLRSRQPLETFIVYELGERITTGTGR